MPGRSAPKEIPAAQPTGEGRDLIEGQGGTDTAGTNPIIAAMPERSRFGRFSRRGAVLEGGEGGGAGRATGAMCSAAGKLVAPQTPDMIPLGAPLLFTVCVDVYRMERAMETRGWRRGTGDLSTLLLGIRDVAYMAQNMDQAGEALGMGSRCGGGGAPYRAARIVEACGLPPRCSRSFSWPWAIRRRILRCIPATRWRPASMKVGFTTWVQR